jgi:hypothetical protein
VNLKERRNKMKRVCRVLLLVVALVTAGSFGQALGQDEASGPKAQKQSQVKKQQKPMKQHTVRDRDGNGVCDICGQSNGAGQKSANGQKAEKGKHWGPADGSGNQSNRPRNGTGYGSNSGRGSGPMDGTGAGNGHGRRGGSGNGRRGGRS